VENFLLGLAAAKACMFITEMETEQIINLLIFKFSVPVAIRKSIMRCVYPNRSPFRLTFLPHPHENVFKSEVFAFLCDISFGESGSRFLQRLPVLFLWDLYT
jgi:hypothetical protein